DSLGFGHAQILVGAHTVAVCSLELGQVAFHARSLGVAWRKCLTQLLELRSPIIDFTAQVTDELLQVLSAARVPPRLHFKVLLREHGDDGVREIRRHGGISRLDTQSQQLSARDSSDSNSLLKIANTEGLTSPTHRFLEHRSGFQFFG